MQTVSHWYRQQREGLKWLAIGVCLIVLVVGQFAQGLFFQGQFLYVHILLGVLGLVCLPLLVARRGFRLSLMDGFVLALGVAYSVSYAFAIHPVAALGEAMRVWTYAIYYFVLSRSLESIQRTKVFLGGVVTAGSVIALFGLMTVPGWFNYTSSWMGGVLSSALQYHNALAGYLLGIMVIAIYFWLKGRGKWHSVVWSVALQIMAMAFAGTQSRGGYLILLVALAFLLLLLQDTDRVYYPLALINIGMAVFFWGKFERAASAHTPWGSLAWLLTGFVSAGLLHCMLREIERRWTASAETNGRGSGKESRGKRRRAVLAGSILAIILILVVVLQHSGGDVLARIRSINFQDHSVEERLVMYWNSIELFRQRPLFGWGGGGWAAAYRLVQSYLYNSTETHSILFKVLVETGLFGFVASLGILAGAGQELLRVQRGQKDPAIQGLALIAGGSLLAVLLHALIDFDLSEGVVSFLLWGMLAVIRGINLSKGTYDKAQERAAPGETTSKGAKAKETKGIGLNSKETELSRSGTRSSSEGRLAVRWGVGTILGIVSIALIVLSLMIQQSLVQVSRADQDLKQGNFGEAADGYKASINIFSLDDRYWTDLGIAYRDTAIVNDNEQGMMNNAIASFQQAQSLNPYNATDADYLTQTLMQMGKTDEAFVESKRLVEAAPFESNSYKLYAQAGMNEILYAPGNNKAQTEQLVDTIAALPASIKAKLDSMAPLYKRNWIDNPKLTVLPEVHLSAGEAAFLKGDLALTKKELEPLTSDKTNGPIAKVWLAALAEKSGDSQTFGQLTHGMDSNTLAMVKGIATLAGKYST